MVLVNHWRAIAFGTFGVLIVAGVVSLFLPRGYRAGCLVMVNPPKAADSLHLAPEPPHMTTAYSLANSDTVLTKTLNSLAHQKALLESIVEKIGGTGDSPAQDLWGSLETLGADRAAEILGQEMDNRFVSTWEDLPPVYLLPALLELDLDYLRSLDAILVKKHLSSRIRTSLENMHQVEYQPVLSLEAEWETPSGAALLSHAWARTLIRTLEEQYLEPTLELQEIVRSRMTEVDRRIESISFERDRIREEGGWQRLNRQKRNLTEDLFGGAVELADWEILPVSPEEAEKEPLVALTEELSNSLKEIERRFAEDQSLIAKKLALESGDARVSSSTGTREELPDLAKEFKTKIAALRESHETLLEMEAQVQALEADLELHELEREYLIRKGAYETRNVNYGEMLGIRMLSPPTPPKTHVSPVIWKNVAIAGLAGFVFMCLLVFASHPLLQIPIERFIRE